MDANKAASFALWISIFLVVGFFAVLAIGRQRRWGRVLCAPDWAGGIGTVLGLLMAIGAAYVVAFQWSLLVLSLGILVWFSWAMVVKYLRENRRELMRFSRRAMALSDRVFRIIAEYRFSALFPINLASQTADDDPLARLQEQYFKSGLRLEIPDFLEELSEDLIDFDQSLLDLAMEIGSSPAGLGDLTLEAIANGLWGIALILKSQAQGNSGDYGPQPA